MLRVVLTIIFLSASSGCASLMNTATGRMADNISAAMLNQDDIETVRAGAPAYLLMIDGLIEGDPKDESLLLTGSKLYSSYSTAFVMNEDRSKRMAEKSLSYARTAMCQKNQTLCAAAGGRLDDLEKILPNINKKDQNVLYGFATAWAGWIQVNTSDWNAIADIPKLTALFQHSIEMDETYDNGGAHLYLGVLTSLLPPNAGGKPEISRQHFERARVLSDGNNLMVNVLYAKHYARLVFKKDLHDQLLSQVLDAETKKPGLTLINTIAKQQAEELLAESNDYF